MPATGKVSQVIGTVVDVEFPPEQLPEIFNALEIRMPNGETLVVEVQQHLGNDWVRCLAMGTTDGLARNVDAVDTGSPISVPVGRTSLGRLFNVLGNPIDNKGPVG